MAGDVLKSSLLALMLVSIAPFSFGADNAAVSDEVEALRDKGYTIQTVTPIFSQLVMYSMPRGFKPVSENGNGMQYIQEAVLQGETVHKWTEMITLTGAKGMAGNPNATPKILAAMIGAGFKKACPDTYSAVAIGSMKFSGHDAFAAVVSCGSTMHAGTVSSESALVIVIKGVNDYYTIQWGERATASGSPINLNDVKWVDRLKKISPIKLCPIVPGEARPYPSCIAQK